MCFYQKMRALFGFLFVYNLSSAILRPFVVFTVLSVGFLHFTNVVQLLHSLSGWLQLVQDLMGPKPIVELHII